MPGLSKVIVLDPDARAGRQVQLGFEREGVPSHIAEIPGDSARFALPLDDAGLVVVGGTDGHALELLRRARLHLDESKVDAPIVFAGRGIRRTDAEAAGADEVVLLPAYLRDLVTIGRLLRGQPATSRDHIVGSLAETTGVYTLVRALSALGRSAVLTLMRGLRRGEVRFFHGEVTSAQVGLIHGQAALHQLLLWTEARFEFHHEDVVRRQQIPMSRDELFADAERFLEGVRNSSGKLSPSMVLEQDLPRIHSLGKQIPTEVHGVLRMFDGHRVLADVLEDSPYRVFETLRVAQRACDVGLLRLAETNKPKATWRTVLAIEEWLVGTDRDAIVGREASAADSQPASSGRDSQSKVKGGKRNRKKRRANTPLAVVQPTTGSKPDIDWGALVPRIVGAEVGPLSGVVPAAHASGEIELPTREAPRERLEALMDTDKRTRIFPTDIGLEPKVVFDEEEDVAKASRERADALERARVEADGRERAAKLMRDRDEAESEKKAAATRVKREAESAAQADTQAKTAAAKAEAAQAKADAATRTDADAKAEAAKSAATAKADADAKAEAAKAPVGIADAVTAKISNARAKAEAAKAELAKLEAEVAQAELEAKAEAKVKAKADAAAAKAKADADAKAKADADAKAKADADAKAKADADAKAKADADAKAKADADAKAKADADAKAKADADAKAKADADAKAKADADAKAKADADAKAKADADAKAKADADAKAKADADAAKANAAKTVSDGKTPEAAPTAGSDGDTGQWLKAAAEAQARADAPKSAFELKAEADASMKAAIAEQLRKKREESEAAEDAKLRAEATEWARQQAAARSKAADDEARDAAKLLERVADVKAKVETETKTADDEQWREAAKRALATAESSDADATTPFVREPVEILMPPVTVAETATSTVVVQDKLTITGSAGTSIVTSTQTATVIEAAVDEPSDGVVMPMATVETAPVPRRPPPGEVPPDDRPEAKTGEISGSRAQRSTVDPASSEPSILINDLAAAHTAIAAAAVAQVVAPPTANVATPAREAVVAEVRKDAVAFSAEEEAFFNAGHEKPTARIEMTGPVETFDDLDEGYKPIGFWDRLRGKKRRAPTSPPPVDTKPPNKKR